MKKIYYVLLSFILLISVAICDVYKTDEEWLNGCVIIESGLTQSRIEHAYDKLPPKVRDIVDKYDIYVVDLIENDELVLGETIYSNRLILIKDNLAWIEKTFFHECGHVLDKENSLTFLSSSDEFQDIYEEEKDKFVAEDNLSYYISTPKEYFASAFAEYMMNPERLKENTPKTYYYINNSVK